MANYVRIWVCGLHPETKVDELTSLIPFLQAELNPGGYATLLCVSSQQAQVAFQKFNGANIRGHLLFVSGMDPTLPVQLAMGQSLLSSIQLIHATVPLAPNTQEQAEAAIQLARWVISQGNAGLGLESMVRTKEAQNPLFSFLQGGPYHDSYLYTKLLFCLNAFFPNSVAPRLPLYELLHQNQTFQNQVQQLNFLHHPQLVTAIRSIQSEIIHQLSQLQTIPDEVKITKPQPPSQPVVEPPKSAVLGALPFVTQTINHLLTLQKTQPLTEAQLKKLNDLQKLQSVTSTPKPQAPIPTVIEIPKQVNLPPPGPPLQIDPNTNLPVGILVNHFRKVYPNGCNTPYTPLKIELDDFVVPILQTPDARLLQKYDEFLKSIK